MTKIDELRLLGSRLDIWYKRQKTALIGSYVAFGISIVNLFHNQDTTIIFITIIMAILSISLHFISTHYFKINYQKSKQLSQEIQRELFNGHTPNS